jgi:limonene-1,2-epoxide hydrolase
MRVLFDPDPAAAGGGTPTTPAAKTDPPAAPPPPPATPTPTATRIEVTPDEYKRLLDDRNRLAEIEAQRQREVDDKENARLKALAEKGQAEEALAQLRTNKDAEVTRERDRANALEREILGDRKKVAISVGLDGVDWVSEKAARDARLILEERFEATRDAAGVVAIREKGTGKPAADVIKEWRASDDSAHYQKATTTGGAGAGATNRSAATTTPADPVARMTEQLKQSIAGSRAGAPGLDGTYGRGIAAPATN